MCVSESEWADVREGACGVDWSRGPVDKACTQRGSHSEAFVLQASDQGESLGQVLACLECLVLAKPPFHREQALVSGLRRKPVTMIIY